MPTTPTIAELQNRIALYKDMKAYKTLYHLLAPGLHRFSISMVRSPEVAEEIVSDVFIKIWQIRDRLEGIENLKVYLYTITRNFSINYLHRSHKNSSLSIDSLDIEPVITYGNPEELCISAEIIAKLRNAIGELPPQCRLIFQLAKEEGLRYKEIAEVMNLSVFTVRNQLAIAVQKLAQALPAYSQHAGAAISRN